MLYLYVAIVLVILAILMFWLAYWAWMKIWWSVFTDAEHREIFLRAFEYKTADVPVLCKHGHVAPHPRDLMVNFCLHVVKRWGKDAQCLEPQFEGFFAGLQDEDEEEEPDESNGD